MGGCEEAPNTCTSKSCHGHEVDIMHFSIGNAIPGRLYGGNPLDNSHGYGGDRWCSVTQSHSKQWLMQVLWLNFFWICFFTLFCILSRFGHLVDVYAWNPHCRFLDGVGPSGALGFYLLLLFMLFTQSFIAIACWLLKDNSWEQLSYPCTHKHAYVI